MTAQPSFGGPLAVRAKYRTIVADPPWPYGREGGGYSWRKGHPSGHERRMLNYPTLRVDQIAALTVGSITEADAHLYLWTTQRYLPDAYTVAMAWGFSVSSVLVWCKRPTGFGVGGAFMSTTEFVLFCRRGSLKPLRRIDRQWFEWPRGRHSQKPAAFMDMVESVSPGPYVELFARPPHRLGWDVWGDQSANTASLVVPS